MSDTGCTPVPDILSFAEEKAGTEVRSSREGWRAYRTETGNMRVGVAQEVVLLYHLTEDTELGKGAIEAFSRAKVPCRHMAQEQLGETVGALASVSPKGKSYGGKIPERSAMVFSGFTSNQPNQVFNRLHSVGPRNQVMEAMVTGTNRTWVFRGLLHELTREHEAVRHQLQEQQDKAGVGQEQSEQNQNKERFKKNNMTILSMGKESNYAQIAIAYLQENWASGESKVIYEDCILDCLSSESLLPQWYLFYDEGKLVGCVGMIPSNFISRMDLCPWLCVSHTGEEYRSHFYGSLLIEWVKMDAVELEYKHLYLYADHVGYYEHYGFAYVTQGHHPQGGDARVYQCGL